jgi:predicted GIY-YIG superfamily endonuclease
MSLNISQISDVVGSRIHFLPKDMIPCNANGKIELTERIKNLSGLIYCYLNTENGKVYVGKTDGSLASRINAHNQAVEHGKDAFHREMRQHPEKFLFGVYEPVEDRDELEDMERAKIEELDSFPHGYNKNKGGGGGVSKRGCLTPIRATRAEGHEGKDLSIFTPRKYHPVEIDQETGKVKFCVTPNSKSKKDVIYVIVEISENGTGEITKKRYIGTTGQNLIKRLYNHAYYVKHGELESSNPELYEAIRKHPERFFVGILYECEDPSNGPAMERVFIKAKRALVKDGGFNKNSGGNGSFARRIFKKKTEEFPITIDENPLWDRRCKKRQKVCETSEENSDPNNQVVEESENQNPNVNGHSEPNAQKLERPPVRRSLSFLPTN